MWQLLVLICFVIMFHCSVSGMLLTEKVRSGTIPVVGEPLVCATSCSIWGTVSYCMCMGITVLLLIYLFVKFEWDNVVDYE